MIRQRPSARRPRGKDDDRRGIAMVLALIMVVLMTAFAVEFNYSAALKNVSAYHHRDETRAYYLAKGGIRIYGLLLIFGRQVAGNSMITGLLESVGLNIDGAAMVCKNIPFLDTAMLRFLMASGGSVDDEEQEGLLSLLGIGDLDPTDKDAPQARGTTGVLSDQPSTRRSLLDIEGDFKVDCADESSRIDINGFDKKEWQALPLQQHPTAALLYGLLSPPEYDPLFEERLKIDRWELIANIKDWVDPDSDRSGLWGGDEDSQYSDFEPRYRAKNSRLDSLEELRLVAGVTDEVFETFGPSLSIHTRNFRVNVNSASPQMIRALLRAFTNPSVVTDQLLDQEIVPLIMAERSFLPGPFRNRNDFMNRVEAKFMARTGQTGWLSDQAKTQLKGLVATGSRVFKLTATGYVNESTSTVEATLRAGKTSVKYREWKEK